MAGKSAKGKQAAPPSGAVAIGLDIGYGVVKAAHQGGTVVFPSVMAETGVIDFGADELARHYPGDLLYASEAAYVVGKRALVQTDDRQLVRLFGRGAAGNDVENETRRVLAMAAIGKALPHVTHGDAVHIVLCAGLPVSHMRYASEIKRTLMGQFPIRTDTANFIANIVQVIVIPQPLGTVAEAWAVDENAADAENIGVLDIGTYTIDASLTRNSDYIAPLSRSEENATYTVHRALSAAYLAEYKTPPSLEQVEALVVTGTCRRQGKPVRFDAERRAAVTALANNVQRLAGNLWGAADDIDMIYITGGGAVLVHQTITAKYPHARLIGNSQTANASGMLRYALAQMDV